MVFRMDFLSWMFELDIRGDRGKVCFSSKDSIFESLFWNCWVFLSRKGEFWSEWVLFYMIIFLFFREVWLIYKKKK